MTAVIDNEGPQKGRLVIQLTGVTSTGNAGQGAVANPEGVPLGITDVDIHFRTGSDGAGNLDAGIGASNAKASDVVSAMDVIEATVGGKFIHGPAAQAAETETAPAIWAADKYLTFTGSADLTGLDATVYVSYIRLTD